MKRLFIAFNLLALLTCTPSDNAYAQHGGGPFTGAAATRTFAALQRYSPDDSSHSQQLAVPENIFVGPKYRSFLETMLARSASFRRQCSRIANEDSLTIHVRMVTVPLAGGVRGITSISRSSAGRIVAHVTVPHGDVEMIAHEFEHIIEQLDEVDLAQKARRSRSGVRATDGGRSVFETTRALHVGLRVVREARGNVIPGK